MNRGIMKSSKHGQIQEREINLYSFHCGKYGCFFPLKFSQLPSQKKQGFPPRWEQGWHLPGRWRPGDVSQHFGGLEHLDAPGPRLSCHLGHWGGSFRQRKTSSSYVIIIQNFFLIHSYIWFYLILFDSIHLSRCWNFHDFPMKIHGVLRCHFPRSVRQANDVSSRSHAVCMLRLQSGGSWLPWLPGSLFASKTTGITGAGLPSAVQNRSKSQWHCFTPARSAAIDRLRRNGEAEGCHVPFQGTTAGGSWNQRFPARAEGPYLSDFFGMFFKYESCALHYVALLCAFFSGRT